MPRRDRRIARVDRGMIVAAGWLDYLSALPSQLRHTLSDGTRVLGVHASPRSDDGPGIDNRITDHELGALLEGCDADIVVAGHTHDATNRKVGSVRAVNLGSVSIAHRSDRRATYALLSADAAGHAIEHRTVDYDRAAEIEALERVCHPAIGYVRRFHEEEPATNYLGRRR